MSNYHRFATASIPASTGAGPTNSSSVDLQADAPTQFHRDAVTVFGATTHDGTITVQVDATSTGDWRDLAQDGSTAAVTVPQGGARRIDGIAGAALRLQSSTGEASQRDFPIWTQ